GRSGAEYLDRDRSPESLILGAPHGRRAAPAEAFDQPVPTADGLAAESKAGWTGGGEHDNPLPTDRTSGQTRPHRLCGIGHWFVAATHAPVGARCAASASRSPSSSSARPSSRIASPRVATRARAEVRRDGCGGGADAEAGRLT